MYEIIKGIPIPENLPAKSAGAPKYPFGDMSVGDSIVVPYEDRRKDESEEQFRNRIAKSAREWSRRNSKGKPEEERKDFAVVVMTADDPGAKSPQEKRYVTGDAVVWRLK